MVATKFIGTHQPVQLHTSLERGSLAEAGARFTMRALRRGLFPDHPKHEEHAANIRIIFAAHSVLDLAEVSHPPRSTERRERVGTALPLASTATKAAP